MGLLDLHVSLQVCKMEKNDIGQNTYSVFLGCYCEEIRINETNLNPLYQFIINYI